jgi:hypothetical protein
LPWSCEAHGGTEFPGRRPCTSLRSRRSAARSLRPISGRPIYPSQAKQLPTENSVGKMWMRISADWGKIYVAVSYFDGVCRCDSCVTSYRRSRCPNQRKKQKGFHERLYQIASLPADSQPRRLPRWAACRLRRMCPCPYFGSDRERRCNCCRGQRNRSCH